MLALHGENPQISEEEYNALFADYDKDGNGVVSKDEMELVLKQARGQEPIVKKEPLVEQENAWRGIQSSLYD